MKQKFEAGDTVLIAHKMPPSMYHFRGGISAVVQHSYKDHYGGTCTDYSLLLLPERGEPYSVAWYPENLLYKVDVPREDGLELIRYLRDKKS